MATTLTDDGVRLHAASTGTGTLCRSKIVNGSGWR